MEGLNTSHLYHAARGDALRELTRLEEARSAYSTGLRLTKSAVEGALLRRKLEELSNTPQR